MSLTQPRYRSAVISAVSAALFTSAVLVVVKTQSQEPKRLTEPAKDVLLKQVEESVDQPLRIVTGDNSPLRIVQANVKEIPAPDFTRLTGRVTDLVTVSSVPEITLLNASGKTVTGFVIAIRDPHSQTTSTISNLKTSISSGATFVVKRDYFVGPQKVVGSDANGKPAHRFLQQRMDSEKYWLIFAARSDIYIAVGAVIFDDGTRWLLKDGGDVK